MNDPVRLRLRTQRLVEFARRTVPVQNGPLETAAVPLQRQRRQVSQQRLADRAPAIGRAHKQILQIQAMLAEKRREIVEVKREARRLAANACNDGLGAWPQPE